MTTQGPGRVATAAMAPAPTAGPLVAVLAGLAVGIPSLVGVISYSAIVYSGPLAPHLAPGVALAMAGAAIMAALAAGWADFPGTVWTPVVSTTLVIALMAAELAGALRGAEPGVVQGTVVLTIALATVLVGAAKVAVGVARLGYLIRFLPYPVLGGFLATTGWLICVRAIGFAAGTADPTRFLEPAALAGWLPAVTLGILMLALVRRTGQGFLILPALLLVFAVFHLWRAFDGTDAAELRARGLLLGSFAPGVALSVPPLGQADLWAVLAVLPKAVVLAGVALVTALMHFVGLETVTRRPGDLDGDLRRLGVANVAAGLAGGMPGSTAPSQTLLGLRIAGGASRLIPLTVAGVFVAAILAGGSFLSVVPTALVAAMLIYTGADFLYHWLWVERQRMPGPDRAIVLGMLGTGAVAGFLPAVALGVAIAAGRFVLAYARLDIVRARTTGAERRSTVERAPGAAAILDARGAGTVIIELQGYLFFGSGHGLRSRVDAETETDGPPLDDLLLDFRRVQGIDISLAVQLAAIARSLEMRGARLWLTGLRLRDRATLAARGLPPGVRFAASLDAALAEIEDGMLGAAAAETAEGPALAALLDAVAREAPELFPVETVPAGAVVLRAGAPSDGMILIERGTLQAELPVAGGPLVVAHFLPGAVVGEIGFYAGTPRTATVRAETDSTIRRIDAAAVERLSAADPAGAAALHRMIGAMLAGRLARTTRLLRQVG
jgi:sulfate permease, SulP family